VIPENAKSERIVIPFEITYDGRLLGQFREAIVVVKTESQ